MAYQYQSFPDAPGLVDSFAKLRSLNLPLLAGKSFLDVGCNEGYYCGVAQSAGANRIVGIDGYAEVIVRARKRYPDIDFRHQSWNTLPEENFDVVLFSSSMHYLKSADEIESMLNGLRRCMAKDGVLIIEAGVVDGNTPELVEVQRSDGSVYYPTLSLMNKLFDKASLTWRPMGTSIVGDGLPRSVFHCRQRQQCVLFVRGEPNTGKSYMARSLVGAEQWRRIELDVLCKELFRSEYPDESLDHSRVSAITELVRRGGISAARGISDVIVKEIASRAPLRKPSFEGECIVIEGLSPLKQEDILIFTTAKDVLADKGFFVWSALSEAPFVSNYWDNDNYVNCGGFLLKRDFETKAVIVSIKQNGDSLQIVGQMGITKRPISIYMLEIDQGFITTSAVTSSKDSEEWVANIPLRNIRLGQERRGIFSVSDMKESEVMFILSLDDFTAIFPDKPALDSWPFAKQRNDSRG